MKKILFFILLFGIIHSCKDNSFLNFFELELSENSVTANGLNEVQVKAVLPDNYNDSIKEVEFSVSPSSAGTFDTSTVLFSNSNDSIVAIGYFKVGASPGTATIKAEITIGDDKYAVTEELELTDILSSGTENITLERVDNDLIYADGNTNFYLKLKAESIDYNQAFTLRCDESVSFVDATGDGRQISIPNLGIDGETIIALWVKQKYGNTRITAKVDGLNLETEIDVPLQAAYPNELIIDATATEISNQGGNLTGNIYYLRNSGDVSEEIRIYPVATQIDSLDTSYSEISVGRFTPPVLYTDTSQSISFEYKTDIVGQEIDTTQSIKLKFYMLENNIEVLADSLFISVNE